MNYPRIDLVVGTRPEAIKLAPVAFALAAQQCRPRIIFTGQHPLDPAEHGLDGFEAVRLTCPGQRNPMAHADHVARQMREILTDPPDLLVVQGDTSSALGGAMAGFAEGVPVAHVEAGLRSFDPAMPWPEEQNRVTIDRLSSLLFAPTRANAANLKAERVQGTAIVTGNTGIDALFGAIDRLGPPDIAPPSARLRILVTCHRRENWGAPMRAVAAALNHLARHQAVEIKLVLHTNPAVAEAMRKAVDASPAISLLAPLTHAEMIMAMLSADIMLSDSGGVQEEAPALGLPLLVLREKTERPEGIASRSSILVGTDRDRIVETVTRLCDPAKRAAMSRTKLPFGDGKSGRRIAAAMLTWIAEEASTLRAAG
ncbi:MAG: UDP-N-acetylglucosamine 2-epimerase (non-hydrolyzing) [Sphingomicrobium sp.]